jgi:hypothetical protein
MDTDTMKFDWDPIKSLWLKSNRGMSFDEITECPLIKRITHSARLNQFLFLFDVADYIWVAPGIDQRDQYFLKTAYPSRKYTKKYREESDETTATESF